MPPSGMIDDLRATFLSAYLIDQIDVTDKLKVRLSARQDWWQEQLALQAFVAGRNAEDGLPLEPGMIQTRTDTPFSWSAGAVQDPARRIALRRRIEKLSHQLQFGSDPERLG
jgi:iron complex outermembrane recepter protein